MSINHYINKIVEVDISGKTKFIGRLVDLGLDVMILYNGHDYLYIPLYTCIVCEKYRKKTIRFYVK